MSKNQTPKMMEVELHFHKSAYGDEIVISTTDMSRHGYPHLGVHTVTVPVPDSDPVKAEIDMLEKKADEVRRDMGDQLNNIEKRIKELAAIEYKPEEK